MVGHLTGTRKRETKRFGTNSSSRDCPAEELKEEEEVPTKHKFHALTEFYLLFNLQWLPSRP